MVYMYNIVFCIEGFTRAPDTECRLTSAARGWWLPVCMPLIGVSADVREEGAPLKA